MRGMQQKLGNLGTISALNSVSTFNVKGFPQLQGETPILTDNIFKLTVLISN